jgi:hypothetical protein
MLPSFVHEQMESSTTIEKRTAMRERSAAREYVKLGVAAE